MNRQILAVIPARGGSQRLPGKNILPLNGKPLIVYTIEAWNKSKYFTRPVIVSTDDDKIAQIARQYGADVINRPPYLSQGDIAPEVLLKHIIDHLIKYEDYRAGVVILLQPTSPLRTVDDIDFCLDLYFQGFSTSVVTISDNSKFTSKENGAIYITHASLIEQGNLYGQRPFYYKMVDERSIDIDTQEDFDLAEKLMKERDADSRVLHQLDRPEHGKGYDKRGKEKRGRPRKVPTV